MYVEVNISTVQYTFHFLNDAISFFTTQIASVALICQKLIYNTSNMGNAHCTMIYFNNILS